MIKNTLFSLLFISTLLSASAHASTASRFGILPSVKHTIISQVASSKTSTESYNYLKEISLSAVEYITSEGEKSNVKLEELISNISVQLEKEAIFLEKEDIVATIISAINS